MSNLKRFRFVGDLGRPIRFAPEDRGRVVEWGIVKLNADPWGRPEPVFSAQGCPPESVTVAAGYAMEWYEK